MADPETTKCPTCDGHGMIGGFVGGAAPGYDSEPCPDCGIKSPTPDGAEAKCDLGDETWGRLQMAYRWLEASVAATRAARAEVNRLHIARYGTPYEGTPYV